MASANRASLRDYYGLQEKDEKEPAPQLSVEDMAATQPLDALLKRSIELMDGTYFY